LWYDVIGSKNSIKYSSFLRQKLFKNTLQTRVNIDNRLRQNRVSKISTYTIPYQWGIILRKHKLTNFLYIIIYSTVYSFVIPICNSKNLLYIDTVTNQIFVTNLFYSLDSSLYTRQLNSLLNTLLKPIFFKIKLKGKGYYIYKNHRNTITPQFGYSHRLYMYSYHTHVKFITKTSLVCFGLSNSRVIKTAKNLVSWRPVNIFTGRGVRFSKQIIYKKSGKVSSYR
jgi:ribosomal protein L6P/L9E